MLEYALWEHREMAEQTLPNQIKSSPLDLSIASIGGADASIVDSLWERSLRGPANAPEVAWVPCIC